jgi:hypothetical protein
MRFGISNRAVCILGNALLQDIGVLNDSNRLCHSKVQHMFEKYGSELAAEIDETRKGNLCYV